MNIVIIGAGLIGAAAAWNLSKQGARVTVLDSGGGATGASFGWINASYYADPHHFELRSEGMVAWGHLAKHVDVGLGTPGCLSWELSGEAQDKQFADLKAMNYPVSQIGREAFARLEPAVATPPQTALHFPQEALVDPGQATAALLRAAQDLGARLIRGVPALGFDPVSGRVDTALGTLFADQILVAAGTATGALLAEYDIALPMVDSPALVMTTNRVARLTDRVLSSDIGDLRQRCDGSFMMPVAVGHQGAKDAVVKGGLSAGEEALHRLQRLFPQAGLQVAGLTLAHRPMPQDGMPAVGRVSDKLYAATLHSGITLGALMGDLIAQEISTGPSNTSEHWLNPYRPQRFSK